MSLQIVRLWNLFRTRLGSDIFRSTNEEFFPPNACFLVFLLSQVFNESKGDSDAVIVRHENFVSFACDPARNMSGVTEYRKPQVQNQQSHKYWSEVVKSN